MTEFLEAALRYAARGWPVLPLSPRSKLPLIPKSEGGRGLKDATTDIGQVHQWWERSPRANVGLRTGDAFDVLDIDGDEGTRSVRQALTENETDRLPPGPRSRTGGGGTHVFFVPLQSGNRAGMLPKVDWRGTGGYIVAPPSVHPDGGRYGWLEDFDAELDLPTAPEWLRKLVVREHADLPVGEVRPLPPSVGDGTPYGVAAMEAELRELARASVGGRNHAVNATSFSLFQLVAGGELADFAVEAGIVQVGTAIGLPEGEVRTALASGREAGLKQPRNAPAWFHVNGNGKHPTNAGGDPAGEEGGRRRGGESQSSKLVALATDRYDFARADTGEPFAIPKEGAYVARMLRGGRDSLRAELASVFAEDTGRAPSSSALADAMLVIEGRAQRGDTVPLALRVARPAVDRVVLDLGDVTGRVAVIDDNGWQVLERSPVLFRRTELTGTLPVPTRGGDLSQLRSLLNVTDAAWPLVVAWLAAALLPDIPHPVLMPTGEQGSGKTTFARMLVQLVDPSPAAVRSAPKDDEAWAVAAAGSHVVALDNISTIAPWLSDALCRAVTGDGLVRRRLYTDSELTVLSIRRVIMLTSIDPGALRGDLADRLLPVELERLKASERMEDAVLAYTFAEARPALLGAVLDLLSEVLDVLPTVQMPSLPRMADFARVAASVDAAREMDSLAAYNALGRRLAAEVVESDHIGSAVKALMADAVMPWTGTASELLDVLKPEHPPKGWPGDGARLSGKLKRVAPALRSVDPPIEVEWEKGAKGARSISIWTQRTGRPRGESLL